MQCCFCSTAFHLPTKTTLFISLSPVVNYANYTVITFFHLIHFNTKEIQRKRCVCLCVCDQLHIICVLKAAATANTDYIRWISFCSRHETNKQTISALVFYLFPLEFSNIPSYSWSYFVFLFFSAAAICSPRKLEGITGEGKHTHHGLCDQTISLANTRHKHEVSGFQRLPVE